MRLLESLWQENCGSASTNAKAEVKQAARCLLIGQKDPIPVLAKMKYCRFTITKACLHPREPQGERQANLFPIKFYFVLFYIAPFTIRIVSKSLQRLKPRARTPWQALWQRKPPF